MLSENYYGYKDFKKGIDNTLIYVESKDRKDILTLCINGDSKENLQRQKMSIAKIIKLNWNILLEKEILSVESKINQQLLNNGIPLQNLEYFKNYFIQEIGLDLYTQQREINYTQINYVSCNLEKIPDLQKLEKQKP